jgi:hypothetical protein
LFQNLRPIIQIGEMNDESLDGIYISWVDRKVMVSLPVGVDPATNEDFDESGVSFDDR